MLSFRFIAISFLIALRRCLHFTDFFFMTRTESVPKHCSIVWQTKFLFQQVLSFPNRTPNERVPPVLLRRCNLSRADFRTCNAQCFRHNSLHGSSNSLVLDALEWKLHGASEHLILFFSKTLKMCSKIDENSGVCRVYTPDTCKEGRRRTPTRIPL